ncbi:Pentatricopeptide repeat-containing protein [Platanthera guangdongensis]|uniref:Pentatricopeptide repeat-containing protein n=1 Tax=Platanthera guangdongensis TaxID=2320717 RepID=A0ABR2LU13_9ASPA
MASVRDAGVRQMSRPNLYSWNILIRAHATRQPELSLRIFSGMLADSPHSPDHFTFPFILKSAAELRDVVSWNSMIAALARADLCDDALDLFEAMNQHGVLPNDITMIGILSACGKKRRLGARQCGDLEKAIHVFRSVENRDVFVWSVMIAGLGMYGRGKEALNLFPEMREAKVKPNHVTFTNILCACSHAGLIKEGSMPEPPPSSVWGALLGACAVHGDVELGELAGEKLLRLEPRNDGTYVLLSNLYARAGRWEDVGLLRKRMKDQGLKKEAGCSSMEVDGVVQEFLAGDASHLLSEKIYKKLGEMMARLRNAGYDPKKT